MEQVVLDFLAHLADKARREDPSMLEEEAQLFEVLWAGLWDVIDGHDAVQVEKTMREKITEIDTRREETITRLRATVEENKRSSDPRAMRQVGRDERLIALWKARRTARPMRLVIEGVLGIRDEELPETLHNRLLAIANEPRPGDSRRV